MNCGIIAVIMGIILSIIDKFFEYALLKSIISKNLSIIGRGLISRICPADENYFKV